MALKIVLAVSISLLRPSHGLPPPAGPAKTMDINSTLKGINAIADAYSSPPDKAGLIGPNPFQGFLTMLEGQRVGTPPATTQDALSALSQMNASSGGSNLYAKAAQMLSAGIVTTDVATLAKGDKDGPASTTNNNPKEPAQAVYPQKASGDAPYSLNEADLRGAIFIPDDFTYGQKQPVILVPGTGNVGYESFKGNFIKLLSGQSFADPVWVNTPGNMLNDAQVNAEYVAYAMNYIAGITGKQVAMISWSQGGPSIQWALKYWQSTREVTNNFIAISPDYHGTIEAYIACPGFPINLLACTPAIIQQDYGSDFVDTLRADGGDSAYVPTTTVYSATDDVVQPQFNVLASAMLKDARNVGVTNNEVQDACKDQKAGGIYLHEGVLYNPLAWELAKDALINGGPGQLSRIDKAQTCALSIPAELDLGDVLSTEGAILDAAVNIIESDARAKKEPAIMSYAATGNKAGLLGGPLGGN